MSEASVSKRHGVRALSKRDSKDSFSRGILYNAPAAASYSLVSKGGMADIMGHRIEYQVGYTYTGNATLGASGSVYFLDSSKTYTYPSLVPIAPPDSVLGQAYVLDLFKHYARVKYRAVRLRLLSLLTETDVSVSVIVAPFRGGGIAVVQKTDTTAALVPANVLGMSGARQIAPWQNLDLDMTPFIAGGSGPAQNEFQIYNGPAAIGNLPNVIPCGFAIAGENNNATAGARVHVVQVCIIVDLLDYIGGISNGSVELNDRLVKDVSFDCSKREGVRGLSSDAKLFVPGAAAHKLITDDQYVRVNEPLETPPQLPATTPVLIRQDGVIRERSLTATVASATGRR